MDKTGKKISELRVVDLKRILEKRGLEKTGNKSVLVERLSKSLAEDGNDPATHIIEFGDQEDGTLNDSQISEGQGEEETKESENQSTTEEAKSDAENAADVEQTESNHAAMNEDSNAEIKDEGQMEQEMSIEETKEEALVPEKQDEADTATVEVSTGDVGCKDGEGDQNNSTEQPPAETMTESVKKNISEPENVGDSLSAPSETVTNPESSASADEVKTDIPVAQMEQTKTADTIDNVELIDMSEEMKKSAEAEDLGEGGGDAEENEDQFVVHVDESDTNLDYDLGDKPEERDAPTPTKDESMDVDAADIIQTGNGATTTEGTGEKTTPKADATSTDQAAKSTAENRTETPKKDGKDLASSQNLWISGLSSMTRATDLKTAFSKHGKVIGAKVVTNANRPGAKCYGYVTMSSSEEAAKCITSMHRTELHNRMISVEKAKSDPAAQARAAAAAKKSATTTEDKKAGESSTPAAKDSTSATSSQGAKEDARTKIEANRTASGDKSHSSHSERHRPSRSSTSTSTTKKEGEAGKDGDKKTDDKDKKPSEKSKAEETLEREKRRLRIQERRLRDEDFRRRQTVLKEKRALAEQQRRLRQEEERMQREREKLRMDREKVKIEEMKMESLDRERARLEGQLMDLRQRVDREREELKRVETLRLEEMRRSAAVKRPYESSGRSSSGRYDDGWESKRPATSDRYSGMPSDSRRGSSGHAVVSTERGYTERRPAPGKEVLSARPDERYSSRGGGGGDRRDYPASSESRGREPARPTSDSRGISRSYHDSGSSRRSGGSSSDRPSGSWSGGQPPSLLGAPTGSNDLFSGAAVQAASLMMNASMSRTGGSSNGTSSRYGSGGSGGSAYGGRRY